MWIPFLDSPVGELPGESLGSLGRPPQLLVDTATEKFMFRHVENHFSVIAMKPFLSCWVPEMATIIITEITAVVFAFVIAVLFGIITCLWFVWKARQLRPRPK